MTKREEALVILMEECGELIQACSKMIRSGGETKYERNLQDEVGDVLTLIEALKISGLVTDKQIEDRIKVIGPIGEIQLVKMPVEDLILLLSPMSPS